MKSRYLLPLCILLAAGGGCVTSTVKLTKPSKTYKATRQIEYLIDKPCRPYRIIAVIDAKGSPQRKESAVAKKVLKRAKGIGAQAIYTMDSSVHYIPPTYKGNKPVQSGHPVDTIIDHIFDSGGYQYNVKVAAIRYINPKKKEQKGAFWVKTDPPAPGCH